jgi:hypothetical protein
MKTYSSVAGFLAVALLVLTMVGAWAADASPVTLTGQLVCGKCTLHLTSECQNVLQVDQNGQTVNYFLAQNKVSKSFHSKVCKTAGIKATVTGTVQQQQDGKEILTATKIEPVK